MKSQLYSAAVYGLSSEGYQIASSLCLAKIPVVIVDERLQMAMELKPEIVPTYSSLHQLAYEEPLLGLKPMEEGINSANIIFFTPKIRGLGEEIRTQIASRLKSVARSISLGSTFIYCLPAGLGDNNDAVSTIERMSGIRVGEDFNYLYAPLPPAAKNPSVAGSMKEFRDKTFINFLKKVGLKWPSILPIDVSEALYSMKVLSKSSALICAQEFYRKISSLKNGRRRRIPGYQDIYLDQMVENLLDLRILLPTIEPGEPALYLTTGVIKSVEGYIRFLVDQIRHLLREKELKSSRSRIVIVWTFDEHEIRGDKIWALSSLDSRLRDYLGDVSHVDRSKTPLTLSEQKSNIILACSKDDCNAVTESLAGEYVMRKVLMLKANLICERTEFE